MWGDENNTLIRAQGSVGDEVVGRRHALELNFRVLQPAIELGKKQLEGAICCHT